MFEQTAGEQVGEFAGVVGAQQFFQRIVERRPEHRCGGEAIAKEVAGAVDVEGFFEELPELVDGRAEIAQDLLESLVLLPGHLGPHDVVEQQVVDIGWCETGEFDPGLVDDDLAELADLGIYVECHGCPSCGAGIGVTN